ncbi:zinc ribbon domain-containing protein [Stutzerimonas stutzeri]|uniref:zinc ribbon domain-containing protein n=1 Tax=Stutzerimonas stutzeri TaxID=316 RepID=UPI001FAFBFD0|nr:zinc ribbon domain-containing protein [Pseudomonas sp. JI-2]
MPTYDYRCEANGQVYEVRHAMALRPRTWDELRVAGALAEDAAIADDAPVTRLLTAAGVVSSRVLKNPEAPACARGGCAGNCR